MPRQTPLEARLAGLADSAGEIIARHELAAARAQLADLQAPAKLTTAAGQALAAITAERRAAERAARAARLRDTPNVALAELDLAANPKDSQ